ncbi:MAG: SEC-C metal-binding domain-containing protein [Candidatus Accumulibacter sp.]|nr:SEC-C metal-binding domain-containing protein [Accumulibacter sp.]MCM8611750.1 SEC-C metal-binding domain-containing protein [Accumulibacter sp.]MCM8635620.1 SEC-C metal-binding domain-containing protein [Accumulibacter sp.]MCM8639219.1 SEC-C metal-binding domain-containing protein [Accumulibacter sp.]
MFNLRNQWGAAEWCEGFILGFRFGEEDWSRLAVGKPTWFTPFLRLGTDDGLDMTRKHGGAERWMNQVARSVAKIHTYRNVRRVRQTGGVERHDFRLGEQQVAAPVVCGGPRIGRNDPCPCGSEKKCKKCCGAADASGGHC